MNKTRNEIDNLNFDQLSEDEKKLYMPVEENGLNFSLG